jgi:hypothetical protein
MVPVAYMACRYAPFSTGGFCYEAETTVGIQTSQRLRKIILAKEISPRL